MALLRKNFLLQSRASKAWYSFGAAGWAALLIEIAVPAVFFALMCIPKHFLDPFHLIQQVTPPRDLDSLAWANAYSGMYTTLKPCHWLLILASFKAGTSMSLPYTTKNTCSTAGQCSNLQNSLNLSRRIPRSRGRGNLVYIGVTYFLIRAASFPFHV